MTKEQLREDIISLAKEEKIKWCVSSVDEDIEHNEVFIAKLFALIASEKELVREEVSKAIELKLGMLRQWLNEDRITDISKMVTNEDIKHWLDLHPQEQEEGKS